LIETEQVISRVQLKILENLRRGLFFNHHRNFPSQSGIQRRKFGEGFLYQHAKLFRSEGKVSFGRHD
jgi:hypothetical protein